MASSDLEAALTGARLVEEVGALLTLGGDREGLVAHAFERLAQLVPFDLATVLLREGEALRVAHAAGPLAHADLRHALIPVRGNLRLVNALQEDAKPRTFDEDDPGTDTFEGLLDLPNGHSCLVAPLRSHGETFGLMTLDASVCHQYPPTVLAHVGVFASLLALGLKQSDVLQEGAAREASLTEEVAYFREVQRRQSERAPLSGQSPAMRAILTELRQVAPTTATVLITGETGTGKEKVAETLHQFSNRHDRPFIKVNCSALPATLIESELFGHMKGAFSGAGAARKGRFELADGGTLFLDEIGDLPLDLQPKLLRAIQEKEIDPLGSERSKKVDVRLVAATHTDLTRAVAEGRFREDLYYRLSVFPIHLPPLRERPDDILALTEAFLERFARDNHLPPLRVPASVAEQLQAYTWPGNVRELHNVLERAAIVSGGKELRLPPGALAARKDRTGKPPTWESQEREYLERLLRHTRGKLSGAEGAAALAGLPPSTLLSRIEKLGLHPRDFRGR